MLEFSFKFSIWLFLSVIFLLISDSALWCPHHLIRQSVPVFEQKTDKFWEFEEQSNSWVEVDLPFDLVSCVNGNCTKVGSIVRMSKTKEEFQEEEVDTPERGEISEKKYGHGAAMDDDAGPVLPLRKRVSLTKMSETSIWVTGQSGSIYERFWNGVQWVTAPRDLPISAGHAISVFIINQTILALSEAGNLYQMQLNEDSQPVWIEFTPTFERSTYDKETEQSSVTVLKSGVVSHDWRKVYFCTMNGSLLELEEAESQSWINHGRPSGADVAAIVDAATMRPDSVFTVSSTGDLYEFDRNSRPSWKKHIWNRRSTQETSLTPSRGCSFHSSSGAKSISLFLITKGGSLVERRLQQRKWKWIDHGGPEHHHLTSVTSVAQDEWNGNILSLFFTTASGSIFEYQLAKHSGTAQGNQIQKKWVNHKHPLHTKVARGIAGLQFQAGRILFPLDDGRLAELHLSVIGVEDSGPTQQLNVRRKILLKYEWSVIEAPETEGWNAEYCSEERGPSNCVTGIKDEPNGSGIARSTRRRKGSQTHQSYLPPNASDSNHAKSLEHINFLENWININFRMRVMHGGRSFFLITDGGIVFEYLYTEDVWLWLRHEHTTAMKGVVGNYNGSLFMVDIHGNLFIRERNSNELAWLNCTAMRKGKQVIGGPPWDEIPGKMMKVTSEDAVFFVSKNGRLLKFTVAFRKFKWKDCRHPPDTRIACIVDQEVFRENVVFVVGRNGRLYQYNRVSDLWHQHYQSPHLILSRFPGTAVRLSSLSLTGSLFMISEAGGLVEYNWNSNEGWIWVEHGTPYKSVSLVGSPGPCFNGNQLFLIGSDGKVYLRYMDQRTWKWKNCGFPSMEATAIKDQTETGTEVKDEICFDENIAVSFENNAESSDDLTKNCDTKVTPTRPIPFSEDSVIFELRDGRLAELRQIDDAQCVWLRIIGTPTSSCMVNYWTAMAS